MAASRESNPNFEPDSWCSGLLADLPRKNCWTSAEHTGDTSPDGLQHLLDRAKWDVALVRDDMRAFVLEYLTDDQAV